MYSASHGLGGKVLPELGADGTTVPMGTGYFAPDNADTASLLVAGTGGLPVSFVDIGASLAKVEFGLILGVDTIDLQQGSVLVLVGESTLEASEHSLAVKTASLLDGYWGSFGCFFSHFGLPGTDFPRWRVEKAHVVSNHQTSWSSWGPTARCWGFLRSLTLTWGQMRLPLARL